MNFSDSGDAFFTSGIPKEAHKVENLLKIFIFGLSNSNSQRAQTRI